jgi:hypothetical protein
MEQHLVSAHSKEELWQWSISYDKIAAALGTESKNLKSSLYSSKVQFRNENFIL